MPQTCNYIQLLLLYFYVTLIIVGTSLRYRFMLSYMCINKYFESKAVSVYVQEQ